MREIKFRIWEKAPIKDGFAGVMIDMDYAMKSDYLKSALEGKYPIMQFTGIKDKNQVDIYEGDIVKSYHNYAISSIKFGEYFHQPNVEDNGDYIIGFYFGKAVNLPFGKDVNGNTEAYEVIGNIYETPELINNTKIK